MSVFEAIERRRSVRDYLPDPIPDDVLDRLLSATRLAPSGANRQPWKLVVVRDGDMKAKIAAACTFTWRTGETRRQDWIARAPVIVVGCGSPRDAAVLYHKDGRIFTAHGAALEEDLKSGPVEYQSTLLVDLAIAFDHLSLAAAAEGLGTCWVMDLEEKTIKELLSIPDELRAPMLMPIGYPAAWPEPRPRKPLEELVSYDRYR